MTPMRLLISGSRRNTNTIPSFIMANFDGSIQYELLRFPDEFAKLLSSKINRLIYRIYPSLLVHKMDKLFLRQVTEFKPTIVLVFKGMEISKWSLERIRAMGVKLVNYNFDHPFNHFSRGTGNRFVKEAVPYYDLHISYSSFICQELQTKFHAKTAWIPFGFHLTTKQYSEVIMENRSEVNRVCFVGNPDEMRVSIIKRLTADGIDIDLYGFGWEKVFSSNGRIKIYPPRKAGSFWSDPSEFWKVLRQYRIQLNFFRPHNEGSHNLRTFEVPAVGGILLTPASAEQEKFFAVGEEIFFYSDYENLLLQCRELLAKPAVWIEKVRDRARQKSLTADYSYTRRTDDLLKVLSDA